VAALGGCAGPPPAHGLLTARYGVFLFEYPAGEEGNVRALGELCGPAGERVARDLGVPLAAEIRVRIVDGEEAFLEAWPGPGRPRRWAAAAADPAGGRIVMKSPRMLLGSRQTYDAVFLHEVAHVALHRALNLPRPAARATGAAQPPGPPGGPHRPAPEIPCWLHEGYAQHLSRQWSPSQEFLLSGAVLRKDLIPLGSLVAGFPREEPRARLAYAESADLVHYLIRRHGNEAFHRFLLHLGRTGSFGAACREVFGEGFHEVERDWKRHLRNRYTWMALLGSAGTLWFLTTLVFLTAYVRKRAAARRTLRDWSEEEEKEPF